MVRVASKYGEGPIQLLSNNEAGERMSQGHRSQREQQMCTLAGARGPSAGGTDSEENVLGSLISARAQPGSKNLGCHLPAQAVEENGQGGCTPLLAIKPFEQRFFGPESFRLATRKGSTSVQVDVSEGVESVFGAGPGSDMGKREEHGKEDTATDLVAENRGIWGFPKNERWHPFLGYEVQILRNSIFRASS